MSFFKRLDRLEAASVTLVWIHNIAMLQEDRALFFPEDSGVVYLALNSESPIYSRNL